MDGESAQFDKDFGGYDNFSNLTVESDNSAVTITFTRQKTDHRDVYLHGQHSVELMKVDKASNVTEFLASDNIYLTGGFVKINLLKLVQLLGSQEADLVYSSKI